MERLDHVIFKTEKLKESVEEFRKAGFNVYYGRVEEKAYNALIYFQDHSFIELIDITKIPGFAKILTRLGVFKVFYPFFHRAGNWAFKDHPIVEYVAYASDIHTLHKSVSGQSTKVRKGVRVNHHNVALSWEYFAPKDLELPFVISDYSPKKYPEENADQHPNGVTGIKKLSISFKGPARDFKSKITDFFNPPKQNIADVTEGFGLQTANAKIIYHLSKVYRIESVLLKTSKQQEFDLSSYGILWDETYDISTN